MDVFEAFKSPDHKLHGDKDKYVATSTTIVLLIIAYGMPQLVTTYRVMPTPYLILQISLIIGVIGVIVHGFVTLARLTGIGIKGYLQIEARLLTNELPSIVQFVSLLSLVTIFLKDVTLRIYITMFIAFLLYLYLNHKRFELVQRLPKKIQEHIYRATLSNLSALVCIALWVIAYSLASLMSASPSS